MSKTSEDFIKKMQTQMETMIIDGSISDYVTSAENLFASRYSLIMELIDKGFINDAEVSFVHFDKALATCLTKMESLYTSLRNSYGLWLVV